MNCAICLFSSRSSCSLLLATFRRLFLATCAILPDDSASEVRKCLCLITDTDSLNKNIDVIFDTLRHQVTQAASLNILLPNSENVISKCLSSVYKCIKVILCEPIRGQEPVWVQQNMLGEAWAYTGLLQSFLLAPQGPVDPAEKKTIMLKYTNQEVCFCMVR